MALQSRLFSGDTALTACLVDDRAHLVLGTQGLHIPKVQSALAILDGALIETNEVAGAQYGKTTAAAVLEYKRKRKIINPQYQSQPDNIVGKMTMASLDREMAVIERAPPLGGCQDERRIGPTRAATEQVVQRLGVADVPRAPANRLLLRVVFQVAKTPTLPTPSTFSLLALIRRGNQLLAQHGMKLAPEAPLESFPYTHSVDTKNQGDVSGIRKAAEKASPGSPRTLRYIFCEFDPRLRNQTGTSQGEKTFIAGFPNFVLVNAQTVHPDFGTLVHEAIHCSADEFMNDIHDPDQTSIYSHGPNRSVLKEVHAVSLRKSTFGPGA